jgi:hypothetical protein
MKSLSHGLAPPLAAALLVMAAAPRPARADDVAEAEALIRQGVQLRQQGNAPRALPLFEKAYQTSRSPRTAAQLGLVELELGYCVEAEHYLTEALAVPDHPWIAKNKATLKRQLEAARKDIGELAVTGGPAGAEIWVNHKVVGKLPLAAPIRLDKGHVDIEVRAANYATAQDTATIAAGKQVQRNYVLAPEPPRAPEPVVAVATIPQPEAAPGGPAATLNTSPAPPKRSSVARPLFWVTAGAAVAALAFGVGEAISAAAKRNDFNNHTTTVGGVTYQDCGTAALSASCQPLKQAYDQAYTLSVVGFVATGVLAAGASALFILSRGERAGAPDAAAGASTHAFACVPDPVSRSLTCNLRF